MSSLSLEAHARAYMAPDLDTRLFDDLHGEGIAALQSSIRHPPQDNRLWTELAELKFTLLLEAESRVKGNTAQRALFDQYGRLTRALADKLGWGLLYGQSSFTLHFDSCGRSRASCDYLAVRPKLLLDNALTVKVVDLGEVHMPAPRSAYPATDPLVYYTAMGQDGPVGTAPSLTGAVDLLVKASWTI